MPFGIASPSVLATALILDWLVGDPRWLWGRLRHPVVLLGSAIEWTDRRFNRGTAAQRLVAGTVLLVVVMTAAVATGVLLVRLGWIVETLAVTIVLAQRDLFDHVAAVAATLRRDGLDEGRRVVARIVGRDTGVLDTHGVCRAAIESCAENFADGVVAPVFWYLLAGLPGLLVYKAVNTLDSMIGHKDERHHAFGRASARLDDLVNFLPARISGLVVIAASVAVKGGDPMGSWAAMVRDAPRHKSPNAGWPEAAFAGALGIAIAGPRRYGGTMVNDAWMGDGRAECTASDIDATLALYVRASLLSGVMAVLLALLAG